MTYLEKYQQGLLMGGISFDECLAVWKEARDQAPSLIEVVNGLDKKEIYSEEHLQEVKSKIDGYGYLVGKLCQWSLKKEANFDEYIVSFCKSVEKKGDPNNWSLISLDNKFYLHSLTESYAIGRSKSLYWIIKSMIPSNQDPVSVFLYTISLKDKKDFVEMIKKHWAINHYYILKKNLSK